MVSSSLSSSTLLFPRRIIHKSWYHCYMITKTVVIGMIGIMICIILVLQIRQQQQNDPSLQPSTPLSESLSSPSKLVLDKLDIDPPSSALPLSSLSPLSSPLSSSIRQHRTHVRSSNSTTTSSSMSVTMDHHNFTMIDNDIFSLSASNTIIEGRDDVIKSSSKRNRMMKETKSLLTFLWDSSRSTLLYLFPNRQRNHHKNSPVTKIILDSIASARDSKFNNRLYNAMEQCMNKTRIPLLITNNTNYTKNNSIPFTKLTHDIWLKLIQYAVKNGTTNDPWGGGGPGIWFEWNPTYINVNLTTTMTSTNSSSINNNNTIFRFPVMEPCNTLSNYAFYRSMVIVYHLNNIHDNSIIKDNYNNIISSSSSSSSISSSSSSSNSISSSSSSISISNSITSTWSIVPNPYRVGFINTLGLLSWGSAFFHASNTNVGAINDVVFISILTYTSYQMMFDNLIPYNSILHELITNPNYTSSNNTNNNNNNNNRTTRSKALDSITRMNTILYTQPIEEWVKLINVVYNDIPFYTLTFAAIISTIANLSFPKILALEISKFLYRLLVTDVTQLEYLDNVFPLLFRNAMTEEKLNKIRFRDRTQLLVRAAGLVIKMIWGFLWQEEIIPGPHLQSIILNRLAARMTPIINQLSNSLTGYDRTSYIFDREFQNSNNVYPDNKRCNALQPHSKWHETAANGLIDLLLLCADTKHIIDGGTLIVNGNYYDDAKIIHENISNLNPHETLSNIEDHDDIECDENMNFLHCGMKNGMSSFDMMDKITNINTDPTVVSITNCFHYLLDSITNSIDGRHFSNCFISELMASSTSSSMSSTTTLFDNSSSASSTATMTVSTSNLDNVNNGTTMQQTTKSQEAQNLDSCLLQNDCIGFIGMLTINIKQLTNCVQSTSTNHNGVDIHDPSCQMSVTEPQKLEQCWQACKFDDNFICVNACILRFKKQVSPSYEQMISCILLLTKTDRQDRSNLADKCFVSSSSTLSRQSSSSLLTFNNVFVHGLEKLTKCSLLGPCRNGYNQFINATSNMQECTSKCYSDRSSDPFRFLKLPTGLSCWLICYGKQSK